MLKKITPKQIKWQRNLRLFLVTLIIVIGIAAALQYWWQFQQHWVETNDAYVTGNIIMLKAQTAGIVTAVNAENTQHVNKGDILVRLDGNHAKIAFDQAKAELGDAVRRTATQFQQLDVYKRKIGAQQASLKRLQHDRERYRLAVHEGGVSAQQLQNTEDQINEIEANIKLIEAEVKTAEATIQGTSIAEHPVVQKAKEALKKAYLDYIRKDIVAPASGYIAKRKAQVGDQVQAGAPLLAIVPLDYLWVEANVKETDLARIQPGQSARVEVDAFGTQYVYQGKVEGLNPGTGSIFSLLPPENASGNFIHIVERVPIRIALAKNELKEHPLRPGLSTVTRIDISQKGDSVLKSMASASEAVYQTDVYRDELADIDKLAQSIIASNLKMK